MKQLEETKARKKGKEEETLTCGLENDSELAEKNQLPLIPDATFACFADNCVVVPPKTNNSYFCEDTNESMQFKYHHRVLGLREISSGFHHLAPIEERSETTNSSSSRSNSTTNNSILFRSSSYQDITDNNYELEQEQMRDRSQTFPSYQRKSQRNKVENLSYNRTLYPFEPREIDPSAFFQLHTADSQDELQEFLLLESQCMSSDEGISAAFINDNDLKFNRDKKP